MEKVIVLLSTYNGEKYLQEQINSILAQTYPNIGIYIRDDNSTDSTPQILKRYESDPRFTIIYGENLGVVGNFITLLKTAKDADYYAFCDQDDVWYPEKIENAVRAIKNVSVNVPAMYFCRLEIVDEKLNHICYSKLFTRPFGLKNAISGNVVTGGASLLNRSGAELVRKCLPVLDTDIIVMHDWWCFIVISAFGKIIYDPKPYTKYRQHTDNVIGIKKNFISQLRVRLRKYFGGKYYKKISRQAREFYKLYGEDLPTEEKVFIQEFIKERSFLSRLAYAVRCPGYRQNTLETLMFRLLILINHI